MLRSTVYMTGWLTTSRARIPGKYFAAFYVSQRNIDAWPSVFTLRDANDMKVLLLGPLNCVSRLHIDLGGALRRGW